MAIVDIYNRALSKVPTRSALSSPEQQTPEGAQCRLWYETVRKSILRAAFWDSCTFSVRLARIASYDPNAIWNAGDPDPQWRYAYAYPSDCLQPRYLTDFTEFKVGLLTADTKVIYANTVQPILTYTLDVTNIALWDAQLELAITYGLAAEICMPLSGKPTRAEVLYAKAKYFIEEANVSSANASAQKYETIPDGMLARGAIANFPPRFYFKVGTYLSSPLVSQQVGKIR